jgi:hypothetical protein
LLGSLASRRTWRHLAATVGTSVKKTGGTISLMAAVQPEPWLQALITNNNNELFC